MKGHLTLLCIRKQLSLVAGPVVRRQWTPPKPVASRPILVAAETTRLSRPQRRKQNLDLRDKQQDVRNYYKVSKQQKGIQEVNSLLEGN
jgi:hypothetical protein